jgi:hypothetical protein
MAAIISDKFRIFNAKQFLESLSETPSTNMYFFVGRPQPWKAYLEVYSKSSTNFTVGNEVFVGTYGSTAFRATVSAVYDGALLLTDVFGSNGINSVPPTGSTLLETADGGSNTTLATATTGVYRYGTEDIPPLPLDNQREKMSLYDEIIAAKRITTDLARTVIRRYNWDVVANPFFDMWKPDYSATPAGGGQVGKQTATNVSAIADAKFYVMNTNYEVFKCLYNGQSPANPNGVNASEEPSTSGGNYNSSTGIYTETTGGLYIWKYVYTIPTDDVLKFLSSDFMPIVLASESTRQAVEALVVDGSLDVAVIEDAGSNFTDGTVYTSVKGDGTGGVVELTISGGAITAASVWSRGSGYSYANVLLGNGNLFSDSALTSAVATPANATGAIEIVLPPQGGHGSDMELELNGKRVMTNIRLTYAEGSGDFPVDNDFRRIGIIKDPLLTATNAAATESTYSGLKAIKVNLNGGSGDYVPDERITQTVTGGTAYGTVVSWVLDSGSTTSGVLKYIQTNDAHTDQGIVRDFESNGSNAVSGGQSSAAGVVDTAYNTGGAVLPLLGHTFTSGLSPSEIKNNSGDVIYVENRRLITRAPDQIEDIKLVIEF